MNEREFYLEASGITKSFTIGKHRIDVLKGVGIQVRRGEWVALLGASGSGKTTLLDIIGTISQPDSGSLVIDGRDLTSISKRELVVFRRKNIGFVFQAYHMLPELNICENVMLPALMENQPKKAVRERALELLTRVGLSHRVNHRANELSGGEQQRAAIARALMNSPRLLLADEPTGNLDSVTGSGILDLFKEFHADADMTIVMVTHDRSVANLADRMVELKDGRLR
ncbi:MAG: ABC transporter ATP-binding protein [Lentisphaeria bacterium]|nr:ABC transporter ATP-binding protein [Lentisphaeria bacterium]